MLHPRLTILPCSLKLVVTYVVNQVYNLYYFVHRSSGALLRVLHLKDFSINFNGGSWFACIYLCIIDSSNRNGWKTCGGHRKLRMRAIICLQVKDFLPLHTMQNSKFWPLVLCLFLDFLFPIFFYRIDGFIKEWSEWKLLLHSIRSLPGIVTYFV